MPRCCSGRCGRRPTTLAARRFRRHRRPVRQRDAGRGRHDKNRRMATTLSDSTLREITARLKTSHQTIARHYPGEAGTRQPVHTVYGGAHLFKSDTTRKLGDLALKAMAQYAPSATVLAEAIGIEPSIAETVYARVQEKLKREAVEDFRIDFEDGYGIRPE